MRKLLFILFFLINLICFSQTFTTKKYLNEPIIETYNVNIKIVETDSTVIIGNNVYTKLLDSYRYIGNEYDLISIETGTFGFLERVYVIKDDKKYLYQHRWYSKHKNKYIPLKEEIYLFNVDSNNFTTGERVVYIK